MSEETISPSIQAAEISYEQRVVAVEDAIDRYHNYLKDYLYRLTRQWQDAENLLQELWKYVLMRFPEDKIGELPLLRKKAHQLFIDHYRKMVRRGETLTDVVPEQPARTFSREAFTDEEEQAFREKFWAEYPEIVLTDQQKEALWLHARYGFTYKEIEERMGVANSTVCDWVAAARKQLAEAVNIQSKTRI